MRRIELALANALVLFSTQPVAQTPTICPASGCFVSMPEYQARMLKKQELDRAHEISEVTLTTGDIEMDKEQ